MNRKDSSDLLLHHAHTNMFPIHSWQSISIVFFLFLFCFHLKQEKKRFCHFVHANNMRALHWTPFYIIPPFERKQRSIWMSKVAGWLELMNVYRGEWTFVVHAQCIWICKSVRNEEKTKRARNHIIAYSNMREEELEIAIKVSL